MGKFLDNNSFFGRLMNAAGIIIASNIMFCAFCLPVVTVGASLTALYHTMFVAFRDEWDINPFKEFFIGFKNNFRQSVLCELILMAIFIFGYLDAFWCEQLGGAFIMFMYAIYAFGVALLILTLYLFPVIAVFNGNIGRLFKNAFYFAASRPHIALVIGVFTTLLQIITFTTDKGMLPLYGFVWVTCGYALTALVTAKLLMKQFSPYISKNRNY